MENEVITIYEVFGKTRFGETYAESCYKSREKAVTKCHELNLVSTLFYVDGNRYDYRKLTFRIED